MISHNDHNSLLNQQTEILNNLSDSVFSRGTKINLEDIQTEDPTLTNFDISKANILNILVSLDKRSPVKRPERVTTSLLSKDFEEHQQTRRRTHEKYKRDADVTFFRVTTPETLPQCNRSTRSEIVATLRFTDQSLS